MVTLEVINYVKQQIASGVSRDQISSSLKQNGWNDSDIGEVFNTLVIPLDTVSQAPRIVKSHTICNIFIVIIILTLLGGAGWFFLQSKSGSVIQNEILDSNNEIPIIQTKNLDDLKINYIAVPVNENSASVFQSVGVNAISKEDNDFLVKFVSDNQTTLRPITQSKKVLTKYKKLLETFEAGVAKKYYQCSIAMGDTCYLNNIRSISRLAVANSFILWKDGKTDEAKDYAHKIIKLGQMITEQADEFITLLVGWEVQKMGYYTLKDVEGGTLSLEVKNDLIKNLREEHKKLFRFDYSRTLEIIDFTTDENNKPSIVIKETDELMNEFRKNVNDITWKPEIVKKWFNDSLKIALSNVDLPCGSVYKDSTIDIGFDPQDTAQTDNFVGKTLYSTTYASLNTTSVKRCEVESLINVL